MTATAATTDRAAALLIVNPDKPEAVAHAASVQSLLADRLGLRVRPCEVREGGPCATLPDTAGAQLAVVLGGDGTVLAAARALLGERIPLLGVNFGRVGFLAGFDAESFQRQAEGVLSTNPMPVRTAHTLVATVHRVNGTAEPACSALNEAVLTAGPPYRMLMLHLRVDGHPGPTVAGDGVIVSTPTGSTAYNVSAGGPIVAPGVDANTITPIAAHSLSFRPIVVPRSSKIEIEIVRANDGDGHGTTLVLDGQESRRVRTGDRVVITSDGPEVQFVLDPTRDYWRTLMGKMRWAETPGRAR